MLQPCSLCSTWQASAYRQKGLTNKPAAVRLLKRQLTRLRTSRLPPLPSSRRHGRFSSAAVPRRLQGQSRVGLHTPRHTQGRQSSASLQRRSAPHQRRSLVPTNPPHLRFPRQQSRSRAEPRTGDSWRHAVVRARRSRCAPAHAALRPGPTRGVPEQEPCAAQLARDRAADQAGLRRLVFAGLQRSVAPVRIHRSRPRRGSAWSHTLATLPRRRRPAAQGGLRESGQAQLCKQGSRGARCVRPTPDGRAHCSSAWATHSAKAADMRRGRISAVCCKARQFVQQMAQGRRARAQRYAALLVICCGVRLDTVCGFAPIPVLLRRRPRCAAGPGALALAPPGGDARG